MALFTKQDVQNVMLHAKCDAATARVWLKHHQGNFARAVISARDDAALTALGKIGGPVTAADIIGASR